MGSKREASFCAQWIRAIPIFVSIVFVIAAFAAGPAPSAGDAQGELRIYDSMTQIGTVACREFKDKNGRIWKTIYYTAKPPFKGPFIEKSVVVQSIRVKSFDQQGRITQEKTYGGMMNLGSVTDHEYVGDEETKAVTYRPDGTRASEFRRYYESTKSVRTQLNFDATGKRLIAINGEIPTDIDLADGWGPVVGGLSCGIGLDREKGSLDQITFEVSIRNSTSKRLAFGHGLEYNTIKVELCNSSGGLVPQDTEFIRQYYTKMPGWNPDSGGMPKPFEPIDPYRVMEVTGPYSLNIWYRKLTPGKYILKVAHVGPDMTFSLPSNSVRFEVQ